MVVVITDCSDHALTIKPSVRPTSGIRIKKAMQRLTGIMLDLTPATERHTITSASTFTAQFT